MTSITSYCLEKRYELKGRLIDPVNRTIVYKNLSHSIRSKQLQILSILAGSESEYTSKERLISELWPHNPVNGEQALHRLISDLRRVLCDNDSDDRLIQTVTRKGYRLAAKARILEDENLDNPKLEQTNDREYNFVGSYQLIRKVHEDKISIDYLARKNGPLDREVLLKVFNLMEQRSELNSAVQHAIKLITILEHPNIARCHDAGGAGDNILYCAMEYAEGSTITDYCRRENLSISERIELFRQVCDGIQHAHDRGIIHGNIQATNLIVTHEMIDPIVKIVDFLMGGDHHIVRNQELEVADDIRSLGLVLFELLCDDVLQSKQVSSEFNVDVLLAKLRQEKCDKDIVAIVKKCLAHSSTRRYRNVVELKDDIRRYLSNNPVRARYTSLGERFIKALKRSPKLSCAVLIYSLLLASITFIAVKTTYDSRLHENFAREQQEVSDQVLDLIAKVFSKANPFYNEIDKEISIESLMDYTLAEIEELQDLTPKKYYSLKAKIAEVYVSTGKHNKALELGKKILKRDGYYDLDLDIGILSLMAWASASLGNPKKSLEYAYASLEKSRKSDNELIKAHSYRTLGYAYSMNNEYAKAKKYIELSLNGFKRFYGATHDMTRRAMQDYGNALNLNGELHEAEKVLHETMLLHHQLGDFDSMSVTQNKFFRGQVLMRLNRPEEAIKLFEEVESVMRNRFSENASEYLIMLGNLSVAYRVTRQFDKAQATIAVALKNTESAIGKNNTNYLSLLITSGEVKLARGDLEDASITLKEAQQILATISANSSHYNSWIKFNLAKISLYKKQYKKAEEQALSVLKDFETNVPKALSLKAGVLAILSSIEAGLGNFESAVVFAEQSLWALQEATPDAIWRIRYSKTAFAYAKYCKDNTVNSPESLRADIKDLRDSNKFTEQELKALTHESCVI